MRTITFVSAISSREILRNNLLLSPVLREPNPHELLLQEGYSSAAKAYNEAIDRSQNDLIVFAHQDVIFPESWTFHLEQALQYLDRDDPNWGVLGCFGMTRDEGERGHIYSSGRGILGGSFDRPQELQTLDEIVLILRKSSGLRFDPALPHFHMYGTDICMRAKKLGRKNYAISAFCIHNTVFNLALPQEFYDCYRHVKRSWGEFLPIQTTCVRITRFDLAMLLRRLQELNLRYVRHKERAASRVPDGRGLLETIREAKTPPIESPAEQTSISLPKVNAVVYSRSSQKPR